MTVNNSNNSTFAPLASNVRENSPSEGVLEFEQQNAAVATENLIETPIEKNLVETSTPIENEKKMSHEVVVESSTSPKIEPQTQNKISHPVIRAIAMGISGPLATNPIDRYSLIKVRNPDSPITFTQSLKNKPLKGTPISIVLATTSNGVFFIIDSASNSQTKKIVSSSKGAYALSVLMASIAEPVIMGPLYTIRTQMQAHDNKTFSQIIIEIAKAPNPLGQVYKGLQMNILRNVIYGVPYFVIYNEALRYLKNDEQTGVQKLINAGFVGAVTGSTISVLSYPTDVISRLQRSDGPGNQFYNKSAYEIATEIVKNEGFLGFYNRGFKLVPPRMFISGGVAGISIALADSLYQKYSTSGVKDHPIRKSSVKIEELKDEFSEAEASKQLTGRVSNGIKAAKDVFLDAPTTIEDSEESEASLSKQLTGRISENVSSFLDSAFSEGLSDIERQSEISEQFTNRIADAVDTFIAGSSTEESTYGTEQERVEALEERKVEEFITMTSNF